MKTIKLFFLATLMLVGGFNAFANNGNDKLIYNNEEVDGLMMSQTVYKNEDNALVNFMQYNFKYDNQKRVIENEGKKWNASTNEWVNDVCIRYTYEGKQVTTTYYKWNKNKKQFVLIPSMTVTMDNTNL